MKTNIQQMAINIIWHTKVDLKFLDYIEYMLYDAFYSGYLSAKELEQGRIEYDTTRFQRMGGTDEEQEQ